MPEITAALVRELRDETNLGMMDCKRALAETDGDKAKAIRLLRAGGVISDTLVATLRQGFMGLFIDFYFETPRRRDLDGGLKITQDAICDALDVNDNRVVDVHLVKRIDPLRPHIEVELEAIVDWDFDVQQYVYLGGGDGTGS